jgi:hypothetical protein
VPSERGAEWEKNEPRSFCGKAIHQGKAMKKKAPLQARRFSAGDLLRRNEFLQGASESVVDAGTNVGMLGA